MKSGSAGDLLLRNGSIEWNDPEVSRQGAENEEIICVILPIQRETTITDF
jgi:hypothetical protein